MTTTNQRAVEELAALVAAVAAEFTGDHTEGVTEDGEPMEPDDSKVAFPEEDCHITFGHIRRAQQALATLRAPGWRPISEAEACTPYLLWDAEEGAVTGFYYDSQWQTFDRSRSLTPTHFHELPTPPPPGEG